MIKKTSAHQGFTLIELLIVMAIIGILASISVFALLGARESANDANRKKDLAKIQSALEFYRADCGSYPLTIPNPGSPLTGDGSSAKCPLTNTYVSSIPTDPTASQSYLYSSDGTVYEICAALENTGLSAVTCGASSTCGSGTCNYKVTQ